MTVDPARPGEWEGDSITAWQRRWNVPVLRILADTASTNDEARALALEGAPAGTVVIADHQSAGRGREGKPWQAAPGQSLLLSVLLRPGAGRRPGIGPVPIRIGLAACRAIEPLTGLGVALKWPNDLLAPDGRKLGGILCEAVSGGDPFVVAGIGINLHQPDSAWPPGLAGRAVSIRAATGVAPDRAALAGALLGALRPFTPGPPELDAAELDEFRRRDALLGRVVVLDDEPTGTAAGIAPDGALIIRSDTGTRLARSGTVRTVQADSVIPRDPSRAHATTANRIRP